MGELTVPLKSRPTRYALAKFLASVELPPSVSVSNLISKDQHEALVASSSSSAGGDMLDEELDAKLDEWPAPVGPLPPVMAVQLVENGVRGHLFSLRESLLQQLEFLLPPPDIDQHNAAHAHFKDYWRWSWSAAPSAAASAVRAPNDEMDELFDDMTDVAREEKANGVDEEDATVGDSEEVEEIVVLLAGDGFPLTENPRQSLTLLRFGLGNLRVLQQSCDAWPLLGIIDESESHPVVRSFRPVLCSLRSVGHCLRALFAVCDG